MICQPVLELSWSHSDAQTHVQISKFYTFSLGPVLLLFSHRLERVNTTTMPGSTDDTKHCYDVNTNYQCRELALVSNADLQAMCRVQENDDLSKVR